MKISNLGSSKPVNSAGRKKKAPDARGGDFASQLKGAVGAPDFPSAVGGAAAGGVDSILAVQEVGATPDATEDKARRDARRYGDHLLDRLTEIRDDILAGAVSKEKLSELARSMRLQRRQSNDPRLNEIVDEIELRAEVEIAKLTHGS